MNSVKQTKWTYKPLSDRRREDGGLGVVRACGSADPTGVRSRSTSRPPTNIQRSASLAYNATDSLTSQIKDFLQRTDRSSRERWRSKSRSVDISSRDSQERQGRSAAMSPNAYSEASLSSRENSIWEEREEVNHGTELEAGSSFNSESLDHQLRHRLSTESSEKYISDNHYEYENDSVTESRSYRIKSRFLNNSTSTTGTGQVEKDEIDTVPRNRYENLKKQLHITTVKLNQQHDMEVDKLMALKKQLEKKLYDTYESFDEQKQLALQWKKKFSKLTSDYSELRLQFDDQLSQRTLLDKKRRKEEADFQYLVDELNQEKKLNDKLFKEKEHIGQEKSRLEETIADMMMELQTKSSQIKALTEELENSKSNVSDLEFENCKKTNNKLKKKIVEMEGELESSLRQVELLEEARYKMEQNIERMKKIHKQEICQKEEEVEEVRFAMEKKIKTLLCQLEQETHEKTLLMKEKYKIERQMDDLQDSVCQSQSTATSLLDKMKNKLIKTKALLKDERSKEQSKTKDNNKVLLRKLRNQLDGVELEKLTAIKTKQKYELEYVDLANSMAELERLKNDTERKLEDAVREIKSQRQLMDDKEEEMSEVMSRFTSTTQQLASNQTVIQELTDKITNVEVENASLIEKIASLQVKLNNKESLATSSSKLQAENFKAKMKEIESKSELDKTMIARKEQQIAQVTAQLEKALAENDKTRNILSDTTRELKSHTRQIKDLQEETKKLSIRESELLMRNKDLALKVESTETEKNMLMGELKLANDRIIKLKEAMDESASYFSDSSTESIDDPTISMVTMNDFKFRSETPDSILSGLSDSETGNKRLSD